MRRGLICLLVLAACGSGGAIALAAFSATTTNPGNSFTAAATFGGMRVATGSYLGTGLDDMPVVVPFQPDVVIVKAATAQNAYMRTSTMVGDASKPVGATGGLANNRIQSFGATGFTVGTNASVNGSGVRYDWVAFKGYANQMKVGSYAGTGTARAISNIGFSPDYVTVLSGASNAVVQRSRTMRTSFRFDATAAGVNGLTSLDDDGFSVGTSAETNTGGTTYHYVAWNAVDGLMQESSYTGTGLDDRNIGGVGFQPDYVIVRSSTTGNLCDRAVHRPASLVGDTSSYFTAVANAANVIQALQATGFQIGTDCKVNTSGKPYYWMAFRNGG